MMETTTARTTTGVIVQPDEDAAAAVATLFAGISELEARVIESSGNVATVELAGSRNAVELALWRIYAADNLTENGATYGEEIAERIGEATA